ncbi:hypothetical protein KSP39_PZI022309 [Platanthera zijinensis]|uniref:Uncharacterized protein n=1 Tax=Platanthera zijinensis TaxID=2320716 RepID=A0AAP0FV87_9ASPA
MSTRPSSRPDLGGLLSAQFWEDVSHRDWAATRPLAPLVAQIWAVSWPPSFGRSLGRPLSGAGGHMVTRPSGLPDLSGLLAAQFWAVVSCQEQATTWPLALLAAQILASSWPPRSGPLSRLRRVVARPLCAPVEFGSLPTGGLSRPPASPECPSPRGRGNYFSIRG